MGLLHMAGWFPSVEGVVLCQGCCYISSVVTFQAYRLCYHGAGVTMEQGAVDIEAVVL